MNLSTKQSYRSRKQTYGYQGSMLVAQLCLILQKDSKPARLLCQWNFSDKNTGVGSHSFLQGIFPTWGSNPGLPLCS